MKVGVIMGGISSEREISLKSGEAVINALKDSKYEVVAIDIKKTEELVEKVKGIDFAFLALHGKFGEDGTVQSVLQTMKIPYSGCSPLSSGICMDKDMTKKVLKACDIRTAKWFTVRSVDEIDYEKVDEYGLPIVVKPNNGGSSVATFILKDKSEIENAVREGLKWDNEVMIEQFIKGDEITCPIFDGEMYPVLAIKPHAEFFDYTAKYSDGGSDEFIVELEENLYKEVKKLALATYKGIKCGVYARVDMIISNGVPYVLEVNTLPGLTANSLFPKSAKGLGIEFPQFIENIIETSLKENR